VNEIQSSPNPASPTAGDVPPAAKSDHRLRVALGVAVGIVVLLVAGRSVADAVLGFARWVEGIGPAGPIVFIVGYAAATVALVPASLLTLAAGAIFGLAGGVAWAFVAAVLGSAGAFLVSRHGGRRFVEDRIAGDARFAAIDRAIGEQGGRIVFLLRLSPVFPFVLLNYALGLTRIGFRDYLLASVGMLPGTLLYVYYGTVAGEVAELAAGGGVQHDTAYYVTLGIGLVATVAVTTVVTRIARRALREATGA
jgi:uncharacterized membrane protein YdjX (TVP38/TMEM64 family)